MRKPVEPTNRFPFCKPKKKFTKAEVDAYIQNFGPPPKGMLLIDLKLKHRAELWGKIEFLKRQEEGYYDKDENLVEYGQQIRESGNIALLIVDARAMAEYIEYKKKRGEYQQPEAEAQEPTLAATTIMNILGKTDYRAQEDSYNGESSDCSLSDILRAIPDRPVEEVAETLPAGMSESVILILWLIFVEQSCWKKESTFGRACRRAEEQETTNQRGCYQHAKSKRRVRGRWSF